MLEMQRVVGAVGVRIFISELLLETPISLTKELYFWPHAEEGGVMDS